ncbi:MAG: type secretion protein, partial [Mycobacterium sp.]|nr:type secretion protein [Mycobacterium sp.]
TVDESGWTVCDTSTPPPAPTVMTTVIAGGIQAVVGAESVSSEPTVLVKPRWDGAAPAYLLYDGRRAAVDLGNPAVVRALQLDGVTPRPISNSLLNAIPEAPPIAAPHIARAGSAGPPSMAGFPVGSVVRMTRADAVEHYVVLTGGVQRVGQVAADLIRFTDSQGSRNIQPVAPDVIRASPAVDTLPISTFPEHAGAATGLGGEPVLCVNWKPRGTAVLLENSLPLSDAAPPVTLAQADGGGPKVDAVLLPPGRSAYVRTTGITGDDSRTESLYLVTDTGVRFGLPDASAAQVLGLSTPAVPTPWPILTLLPYGAELSRGGALIGRDGITTAGGVPAS